jgi:hypothetical protein
VFLVPWAWLDTPVDNLNELGFQTAAMALSDDSIALDNPLLKSIDRLALIMGTEGDGLPHSTLTKANYVVRIPMSHHVDSLNVAAAAAVERERLQRRLRSLRVARRVAEILEDVLKTATPDITEKLYSLLQGDRVIARIDQNVVYKSLTEEPANIYSLLFVAGYLKAPKKELQGDGTWLCEVAIPNREIAAVYKSEILSHLLQIGVMGRTTANKIAESLYALDTKKLQDGIGEYIKKSISYYDSGAEGFYHGLVLGLVALMDNQYKIRSNRESGDGRYDICMIPRDPKYPGIIMELKSEKRLNDKALETLSFDALKQIDDSGYDHELKAEGVISILKLGIAFSGKKVIIRTD